MKLCNVCRIGLVGKRQDEGMLLGVREGEGGNYKSTSFQKDNVCNLDFLLFLFYHPPYIAKSFQIRKCNILVFQIHIEP